MSKPPDRERSVLLRMAKEAVRDKAANGGVARIWYSYKCEGCRKRQTIATPDVLPPKAKCGCGHVTTIKKGSFFVRMMKNEESNA